MLEPAVTLTDYALALECAAVCLLLARSRRASLARSFILMFAGIGTAALMGGTVHGFFPDSAAPAYQALWTITLLGVGVMALAGWRIGASLLFDEKAAHRAHLAALWQFALYAMFVLLVSQEFMAAVINYMPAALFMLCAFVLHYRKRPSRPLKLGVLALFMTFVSSGVQMGKISLHPVYLDHNVLYHVIQFAAIILLYVTARHLADGGKA